MCYTFKSWDNFKRFQSESGKQTTVRAESRYSAMAQKLQLAGAVEAPAWDCSDLNHCVMSPNVGVAFRHESQCHLKQTEKFAQLLTAQRARLEEELIFALFTDLFEQPNVQSPGMGYPWHRRQAQIKRPHVQSHQSTGP